MTISVEKFKKLRKHHGWSQEKLSEISGVSLRTIQRVETGESVALETQLAIATAFNVSPSELMLTEELEIGKGGINWGGVSGVTLCIFMIYLQFRLAGAPYFDYVSLLLAIGLPIAMAAISFGVSNAISIISMLRWIIFLPKSEIGLQNKIPYLNQYIVYCHTGGAISTLIGVIAVFMTPELYVWNYQPDPKSPILFALGIAFLTTLYAAMFAELILRPLKHQIENLIIKQVSHRI